MNTCNMNKPSPSTQSHPNSTVTATAADTWMNCVQGRKPALKIIMGERQHRWTSTHMLILCAGCFLQEPRKDGAVGNTPPRNVELLASMPPTSLVSPSRPLEQASLCWNSPTGREHHLALWTWSLLPKLYYLESHKLFGLVSLGQKNGSFNCQAFPLKRFFLLLWLTFKYIHLLKKERKLICSITLGPRMLLQMLRILETL